MNSLTAIEYLIEFCKMDFCDRQEPSDNELGQNKQGYFMFDSKKLDTYKSALHMANTLYKTDKIYLNGSYSHIYAALEALIENDLHVQIKMLDIEINIWDNKEVSWHLFSKFINLKLLYIDGCNSVRYTIYIPNITMHLPDSLEALSIINIPYNNPFSQQIKTSNLKIIKLMSLTFNQELGNLPPTLETLIIESNTFNQSMSNLPSGLKHLILLCSLFTMPLDTLPHGLKYFAGLHFNSGFVYSENELELNNLPSSIKTIVLDIELYKQKDILTQIYKNCKIICYTDFNNFEFILNTLLDN